MTGKRFSIELQNNDIYDKETNTFYCDNDSICNLLNEQQELIEELHISDHMGWGRAEKFEKELKQKKIYIKRLEYKVQKFKEMNSEQQATISALKEENEQLRQMIKENVFQRYREGSLADLEFKAIAYDDIVKVEMSNELEPRVIVYCKQGKKEDIMSYCQMVIPFGIAYEIKEVMNDVLK